ncbi:MAG: ATP-dependent Clp protease adaptor ClpS [Calditrichia bacterium]
MLSKQYQKKKERLIRSLSMAAPRLQGALNEQAFDNLVGTTAERLYGYRSDAPAAKYPWEPGYVPDDPDVITLPEIRKDPFEAPRELVRLAPRYHVVLHNDDDHSYEYVIEMLGDLFGHNRLIAFQMACTVDFSGRVVVDTTSKERAELKRDQIHNYGSDWRIPQCKGSMSASIEPAEDE